jgi:hypothetical protein
VEFASDVHKQTYERVRGMTESLFGTTFVKFNEDVPLMHVPHGSTFASIQVSPWADSAVVRVTAHVARGVTVDAALLEELNRQNNQFVFGAFLVDEDADVLFQQTILGPTIDEDELRHTVQAVLTTADQVDEQIVARWGGRRGMD